MYRTTFLCDVQFASSELFDSIFGEQQKSLQAKLDLNEKYEQRPKFFISIECFGCVIMVFVSHPHFMLLLLFLLLYGIHRKMS